MKPRKTSTQNGPAGTRSGAFLIVAMVCLMLSTALLGTLLKMAVLGRQQAGIAAAGLQADWLAESALDRAAAKLAADAAYKGETWEVPAKELDGRHAGRVVISVRPAMSNRRAVEVVARFPVEGSESVQRTRRVSVAAAENDSPETKDPAPAAAEKTERGGERE